MPELVLWEPEIPPNTGNVSRLAVALDWPLHLIAPLGFDLSDRQLKRAGLDYWDRLRLTVHPDRAAWEASTTGRRRWYFSTKATRTLWEADFEAHDLLVFGPESRGLPPDVIAGAGDRLLLIPQGPGVRSLNLSNCVAIAAYEALRQNPHLRP